MPKDTVMSSHPPSHISGWRLYHSVPATTTPGQSKDIMSLPGKNTKFTPDNHEHMNNILRRFLLWWRSLRFFRYYVIVDSNDNSITLSRKLYHHIELSSHCEDAAKVYVFEVPAWRTYGFAVNPEFDRKTQLADIQYNDRHRTIGFESLCPTVNRIFFDYGLPAGLRIKLTVTIRRLADGKIFYNIERPRQ